MGREKIRYEWERIMGRAAWCAKELVPILKISPLNVRRNLRRSYHARRLARKRFGNIYFYVPRRFLSPPDGSYPCPFCNGRMDIYHNPCGCEFQMCGMDSHHNHYKYCEKHKMLTRKSKSSSDKTTDTEVKERAGKDNTAIETLGTEDRETSSRATADCCSSCS